MAPQTLRGVLVFGVGWTAAAAAITSISITAGQRILHCLKRVFFDGPRRRSRRPIHHSSATLDQCKTYIASLGSHQMICDADLRRDHHFWAEAHSFRSDPALAQSKARISNEIRSLSTSLPLHWESSIFLAIDENHMNMMRALIIPGEATPYANGMFLFDIFLPQEYPNVPPKVQFLTTYGGRIRFNPNLYTDGRVCLSLLGTWDGPSWKPSSTVLQVLVSIQSLIFVEEPYWNEPRYELQKGRPHAESESWTYTLISRYHTLAYAIAPAIKKPMRPFERVCRTHFALKREDIKRQCDRWLGEAKGWQYEPQLASVCVTVKRMLDGAGDHPGVDVSDQ